MADRRAQIEARLAEVTPGPWRVDRYDHGGGRAYIEEPRRTLIADFYQEGDREMLASAPDDLRWLLDALAEAEAQRDALAAKVAAVEALAEQGDYHWIVVDAPDGEYVQEGSPCVSVDDLRDAIGDAS